MVSPETKPLPADFNPFYSRIGRGENRKSIHRSLLFFILPPPPPHQPINPRTDGDAEQIFNAIDDLGRARRNGPLQEFSALHFECVSWLYLPFQTPTRIELKVSSRFRGSFPYKKATFS